MDAHRRARHHDRNRHRRRPRPTSGRSTGAFSILRVLLQVPAGTPGVLARTPKAFLRSRRRSCSQRATGPKNPSPRAQRSATGAALRARIMARTEIFGSPVVLRACPNPCRRAATVARACARLQRGDERRNAISTVSPAASLPSGFRAAKAVAQLRTKPSACSSRQPAGTGASAATGITV
jgi:hypothetical protein